MLIPSLTLRFTAEFTNLVPHSSRALFEHSSHPALDSESQATNRTYAAIRSQPVLAQCRFGFNSVTWDSASEP